MSKIALQNLSFAYPGQDAVFKQVDLVMDTAWKTGLVGRNGRGKTTLLKILTGALKGDGRISTDIKLTYFPPVVAKPDALTMEVLQDLTGAWTWELEREIALLHVDLTALWRPFNTLSGGEQTKVLLASVFLDDINFPLLDEPTNHLDAPTRRQVAEYLQRQRHGYIVISHDRAFLNAVTNHTVAIEKQQLITYQGNFAVYEAQKKLRDTTELATNAKLKQEIGRLKETARQKRTFSAAREGDKYGKRLEKGSGAVFNNGWIGTRAARVMKKAKNLEQRMDNQINAKAKLLKNIETTAQLTMNYEPTHHQTCIVAQAMNMQIKSGKLPLFEQVDFTLFRGKRLAISGANGVGKSKLVSGILDQTELIINGDLKLTPGLKISYVPQNVDNLAGSLMEYTKINQIEYEQLVWHLRQFGLEREVLTTPLEQMSMGQKKKVVLARSLSELANLYIWDEPLNYLDVFNQEQLIELILRVQPTMLIIEHDQHFIEQVADQVVDLKRLGD
ncbi:MAG: ATP-binding cassette domain-containing protein [Lactobacillaceae bacterium]|nr:ATP-binding cassette domain-containing protein [Lactobacillaceae bacterium]